MNKDKMITFIFAVNAFFVLALVGFFLLKSNFFSNHNYSKHSVRTAMVEEIAGSFGGAEMDYAASPAPSSAMMRSAKSVSHSSSPQSLAGSLMLSTADASVRSKYIIKNGSIRGRVDSLEKTKQALPEVLKKHKAYIFSEDESNSNYSKNLNLTVKVPAENFDTLLLDLSKLTIHLDSKSSNLQDVMKQFVETEERIKSQKLLREKFRKLITQSKRVEDTLKIEQQLSSIQRQIESSKRILDNLKQQISVSSININYYEQKPVSEQKPKIGFLRQILDSVSNGWNKLRGTVLFFISMWPFILIIVFGIFGFKKFRRRKS